MILPTNQFNFKSEFSCFIIYSPETALHIKIFMKCHEHEQNNHKFVFVSAAVIKYFPPPPWCLEVWVYAPKPGILPQGLIM